MKALIIFVKGFVLINATSKFLFPVESGNIGGCGKTIRVASCKVLITSVQHCCPDVFVASSPSDLPISDILACSSVLAHLAFLNS